MSKNYQTTIGAQGQWTWHGGATPPNSTTSGPVIGHPVPVFYGNDTLKLSKQNCHVTQTVELKPKDGKIGQPLPFVWPHDKLVFDIEPDDTLTVVPNTGTPTYWKLSIYPKGAEKDKIDPEFEVGAGDYDSTSA